MREDFNRLHEIMKKDWLFIEMDQLTDINHPFSAFYDKGLYSKQTSKSSNMSLWRLYETSKRYWNFTSLRRHKQLFKEPP